MVRVISILFLLFLTIGHTITSQTSAPMDFGSIELLIDRHKKQHDRLEERNKQEAEHNGATLLVKDIATKYEKLHKDLMSKYALATQWVNLGISSIGLLTEVKNLGKVLPSFFSYAHKITNPFILQKYINAGKRVKNEIDFCVKALASLPALRLNASELTELVELIKEHLYRIRYTISSYALSIRGQALYNQLYEKPTLPDYARIANEIVKEYYPSKKQ